jgi:hypothetical protein
LKTDTCLSAFIALLMSAVLTAPVHAAADGKESSQVWRARLVKCDPSSTGVQESAGLVGLGAVLLERGFAVAAGAIRKGIAAAGKDKSVSFIADHPAYLVRMDANRMRHDLRCVVIARGTPLAPFETASNPPTIDNANQAVQASVRNGLAALGLSGVSFYANVAFKPSDDGAATRAVVTQLYYPRRLFAGRGSAVRTLNVTAVVTAPGQDKSMLAASLTFEDLATRAALVHDDNGLEAKSAVGWFVTPKVELSESQKRRSGFAYPVNLLHGAGCLSGRRDLEGGHRGREAGTAARKPRRRPGCRAGRLPEGHRRLFPRHGHTGRRLHRLRDRTHGEQPRQSLGGLFRRRLRLPHARGRPHPGHAGAFPGNHARAGDLPGTGRLNAWGMDVRHSRPHPRPKAPTMNKKARARRRAARLKSIR